MWTDFSQLENDTCFLIVGVSCICAMTSSDIEKDLGGLEAREELEVGIGALMGLQEERLSKTKWYAIAKCSSSLSPLKIRHER